MPCHAQGVRILDTPLPGQIKRKEGVDRQSLQESLAIFRGMIRLDFQEVGADGTAPAPPVIQFAANLGAGRGFA
jgi:hypothetical protein